MRHAPSPRFLRAALAVALLTTAATLPAGQTNKDNKDKKRQEQRQKEAAEKEQTLGDYQERIATILGEHDGLNREDLEKMSKSLALNDEQRQKIEAIGDAKAEALTKFATDSDPKIGKIKEQLDDARNPLDKKNLLDRLAIIASRRADLIESFDNRVVAILSPEQRTKHYGAKLWTKVRSELGFYAQGIDDAKAREVCEQTVRAYPGNDLESVEHVDPDKNGGGLENCANKATRDIVSTLMDKKRRQEYLQYLEDVKQGKIDPKKDQKKDAAKKDAKKDAAKK